MDAGANLVLRTLVDHGYGPFLGELEFTELGAGARLAGAGEPIPFAIFPLSGLLSIRARYGRRPVEIGMVGPESMVGMRAFFGGARLPVDVVVDVPGTALRLDAPRFSELIWADSDFYAVFMPFIGRWLAQVGEAATANARCSIKQKVVRRILMAQDRLRGAAVPATHIGLAAALAVRRASVTMTLIQLEKEELLCNERGRITVLRREDLIAIVDNVYTPVVL